MSASSVPPSNLLSPRERAEAALRRGPSSAAAAAAGSSAAPPPHSHRSLLAARALATRQAASAGSERRGGKKRAASASGSGRGGNARGKRPATAVPSSDDDDDDDDQAAEDHFTTAPRSEREEKATRFTRHCREGCNGVRGILAKRGPDKLELLPYAHQWEGVRRATMKEVMLWMYDAGLGKTAMAALLLAALEQQKTDSEGRHVGGCNMICIVPPSCLQQWEDTMHCWLATRGKTPAVQTNEIVRLDASREATAHTLRRARVLITTRMILTNLFKQCFERASRGVQDDNNRWRTEWVRKAGAPLHPIFGVERPSGGAATCDVHAVWDVGVIDEVQLMRNERTGWTFACAQLAKACRKRVGLSATPVYNGPQDMVGVCKALGMPSQFCEKRSWTTAVGGGTLNLTTLKAFEEWSDRCDDSKIDLPPLTSEFLNYSPALPGQVPLPTVQLKRPNAAESLPEDDEVSDDDDGGGGGARSALTRRFVRVEDDEEGGRVAMIDVHAMYEGVRGDAEKLKIALSRIENKERKEQLKQLLSKLVKMTQILVSPPLALYDAPTIHANPELVDACARVQTGALRSLRALIVRLQREGHARIIVASTLTTILKVARRHIEIFDPAIGPCFTYDGTVSAKHREHIKTTFLTLPAPGGVLFLSIPAGGMGLHLVRAPPHGCTAIVFFEGRCYSPAAEKQCWKRIHRIGQTEPCVRKHMVANGSVGHAIGRVHVDKAGLHDAIVDRNLHHLDGDAVTWRKAGRIVDGCWPLGGDGNFVEPPKTKRRMPSFLPVAPVPMPQALPVQTPPALPSMPLGPGGPRFGPPKLAPRRLGALGLFRAPTPGTRPVTASVGSSVDYAAAVATAGHSDDDISEEDLE